MGIKPYTSEAVSQNSSPTADEAVTPVGDRSDALSGSESEQKPSLLILPATAEDLETIADYYVIAYTTGAWEGEKHEKSGVLKRLQDNFIDPNFRILSLKLGTEIVGFSITRKVPIGEIVEDISADLLVNSQVIISDQEKDTLSRAFAETLQVPSIEYSDQNMFAGVFQDIVIIPEYLYLGRRGYLNLMINATRMLLEDSTVAMIVVYTKEDVSTIVKTLVGMGGSLALKVEKLRDGSDSEGEKAKDVYVVYSGNSDQVRPKFKEFCQRFKI